MKIIVNGNNISSWQERKIKEQLRKYFNDLDFDFIMVYNDS